MLSISRIRDAVRQAREDYNLGMAYLKKRHKLADYMEEKDILECELLALITIPIQFGARLIGRDYWKVSELEKA